MQTLAMSNTSSTVLSNNLSSREWMLLTGYLVSKSNSNNNRASACFARSCSDTDAWRADALSSVLADFACSRQRKRTTRLVPRSCYTTDASDSQHRHNDGYVRTCLVCVRKPVQQHKLVFVLSCVTTKICDIFIFVWLLTWFLILIYWSFLKHYHSIPQCKIGLILWFDHFFSKHVIAYLIFLQ